MWAKLGFFSSIPLRNKTIWEYTANYNVIYYIIHFHILETSAYIFQCTAIYALTIYGYILIHANIFRNEDKDKSNIHNV